MNLGDVFDAVPWDRKFAQFPDDTAEIIRVWRPGREAAALEYLGGIDEDGDFCRSLFLFTDSLGEGLAMCEEEWD